VRNREILQSEEAAAPSASSGTHPTYRIFVINGEGKLLQANAEPPIRHATESVVGRTYINRKQNQALDSASEHQLDDLLTCPISHPQVLRVITTNKQQQ
jgi:hypothetical protein